MADLLPLRIAVVGHVDHGKSTLIGRLFYEAGSIDASRLMPKRGHPSFRASEELRTLTGEIAAQKEECPLFDPEDEEWAFLIDNLQEERDRYMSIDTAQAFFSTGRRNLVIIDTPGHQEFLKNMITGVTRSDAAVLLVAADEGVREQTRRHACVLALVGIKEVLVACNKMDLVEYSQERYERVGRQTLDLLDAVGLAPRAVVPISAKKGCNVGSASENMPWYTGPCLAAAIEELEVTPTNTWPARFAIQDIYPYGEGSCFAGRLLSGTIMEGEQLTVYPSGEKARVTEIVRFPASREPALPGECMALTLDGAAPVRGQVLGAGAPPYVSERVQGRVFWWRPEPLRPSDRVLFRCATQEVEGFLTRIGRRIDTATTEVILSDQNELRPTEVADLELECSHPVVSEAFHKLPALGRFVLEINGQAAGAGIVLEESGQ
jgi:bifunctional enzyme CysN/CysC